jgi:hypothetical protein
MLDNFEQLVGAAPWLADLLGAAPGLKLLVTSRVLLRLTAEHELAVGPLEPGDAVALFTDRARAANADLVMSSGTMRDVQAACDRLEGVPLALELAAARLRALSPRGLLERLHKRLTYLTAGPRCGSGRRGPAAARLVQRHPCPVRLRSGAISRSPTVSTRRPPTSLGPPVTTRSQAWLSSIAPTSRLPSANTIGPDAWHRKQSRLAQRRFHAFAFWLRPKRASAASAKRSPGCVRQSR